jgi:hypothetical protein
LKIPTILKNVTPLDWVLIAAFTVLVAVLVQLMFPPYGWAIGLVAALFLLFLAKSRRDKLNRDQNQ